MIGSCSRVRGQVIEQPEVFAVQDLGPDAVVVRVTLKTAPLEQWAVAREMRQRVKARFDYEGIEIPLPQRVVWHRQEPGLAAPETPAEADPRVDRGEVAGRVRGVACRPIRARCP